MSQFFRGLNQQLVGWPSGVLTLLLLGMAAFLVILAFRGTPSQKAGGVLYTYLP